MPSCKCDNFGFGSLAQKIKNILARIKLMPLFYLIGYITVEFQSWKLNSLGLIDETLVWLKCNAGTVLSQFLDPR